MKPRINLLISVLFLFFFVCPAGAAEDSDSIVLQGVISGGLDNWVTGIGDGLIKDNTLQVNNETERIGIFDSIVEPIPYASEEYLREKSGDSMPLCVLLSKIIVLMTALACLLQIVAPGVAAGVTSFFQGQATYHDPKEVLITARNLVLWFACGPGLLLGMYFLCNSLMSNIDTSALDQVVISSENMINYLFFGITAKGVKIYMAVRSIVFLEVSEYWWVFGILISIKKTRWVAILGLEYLAIQVFAQPLIVTVLTNIVAFTLSGRLAAFGPDMLIYGCCTMLIFDICFLAATAPIWIKVLSPSTIRTVIVFAKYL
jgi:hypothetical protein